jgi:hypothetical protein
MPVPDHDSWIQRLYRRIRRQAPAATVRADRDRPAEVSVVPSMVVQPPVEGPRSIEDWRDLLRAGRRVVVSWGSGGARGAMMAQGEVRMIFEETVWIWLDQEISEDGRPLAGQAIQVLAPRRDAMRLVPGRLLEAGQGRSLQIEVSGRVSRVQRRGDVRTRVSLPPVSAVRLNRAGKPVGLLGLHALDLSAGGIRVTSEEPLHGGDRLRVALRLDDRGPLNAQVEILVGGLSAQGRFGEMPDGDRQRIVQYVYRQELAQRKLERAAQSAE